MSTSQPKHVSLLSTFSTGSIDEWFVRFDICSKANGWNDEMKALKVPTLLEGEALASWLELTEEEQADFKTLKKKLIAKMAPLPFTALEEFHARKLRPGEPLPLFTQDLKRLLQSAMPGLDENAGEQMLIHQFLTGLPTDISRQLRATGEAKKLTKVVERARLLMTIDNQSSSQSVAACTSKLETETKDEMSQLQHQVEALTQQVAALATQKSTNLRSRPGLMRCFNCNGLGHLQRNCPSPPTQGRLLRSGRVCFKCGQHGHTQKECRRQGNGAGVFGLGPRHPGY